MENSDKKEAPKCPKKTDGKFTFAGTATIAAIGFGAGLFLAPSVYVYDISGTYKGHFDREMTTYVEQRGQEVRKQHWEQVKNSVEDAMNEDPKWVERVSESVSNQKEPEEVTIYSF